MDRNLTILIIEDDPNDALLLQKALAREGIKNPLQFVQDGAQAISYLQGEEEYADRHRFPFPSVIFTDLKMPRSGGFDVLSWLKQNSECGVIPVIVLSASKLEGDVRKAYQMGANAYMAKPARLPELQKMVKTAYEFWACCEKPQPPLRRKHKVTHTH